MKIIVRQGGGNRFARSTLRPCLSRTDGLDFAPPLSFDPAVPPVGYARVKASG